MDGVVLRLCERQDVLLDKAIFPVIVKQIKVGQCEPFAEKVGVGYLLQCVVDDIMLDGYIVAEGVGDGGAVLYFVDVYSAVGMFVYHVGEDEDSIVVKPCFVQGHFSRLLEQLGSKDGVLIHLEP